MRLVALAVLALTSNLGVEAIRPRLPSAPPYPVPSANTSTHGLSGTSIVPPTSPKATPKTTPKGHESSSSTYKPTGHAHPSGSINKPKPAGNSTSKAPSKCSGQTLNVLDASLDWWYTRTLYNVVSTISIQHNRNDTSTGWTVLPATTPFDLSSAMASPTCTSSLTWNTYWNASLWDISCTPAPTPVAASTTILTQTAFKPLNASTGTGRIPDVVRTPPPATITIPSSGGSYAQGTPFVFFSAYEIVSKTRATFGNGSVGCAAATQTYQMASPFSFEYADGEVNGTKEVGAGVTGDVNPAFLQVVGQSAAVAGSWVAAPTVAVVVQDIYAVEAVMAAKAGPILSTHTILQTPEPTLPPGFSTGMPGTKLSPTGPPGHVESTAPSLDVPTQVHNTRPNPTKPNGGSPTPKTGPNGKPTRPNGGSPAPNTSPNGQPTRTNGGGTLVTTGPNGKPSPVETTGSNGKPTPVRVTTGPNGKPTPVGGKNTPGNGPKPNKTKGPINNIVSAILSAVTPTNALEVLEQAQASFTRHNNNPTAEAIVKGLTPGSNTRLVIGPHAKPTLVIGGTTITANAQTQFHVGTAILTPGGTVVDHGTTVAIDSSLSAVVVNGQTHVASAAGVTPAPVLTIGGSTYAPSNGPTYIIGGQTLAPGSAITVQGTTISLGQGGSSVVVNGLTQKLATASPASVTALPASITAPPALTIGHETFTAINNGPNGPTYNINGETLTPGELETVTVDGKTYVVSLAPGATVLIVETVGPNGDVTATAYETLHAGGSSTGSQSTVTNIVGAGTGSKPSAGPSHTVNPSMQNSAASLGLDLSAVCAFFTAILLAIWL